MPNVSSQGTAHVAPGTYIQVSDPAGSFSDTEVFSGKLRGDYSINEASGVTDITNSESPQNAAGKIQREFIENKIDDVKTLSFMLLHAPEDAVPLGLLRDIRINWAARRGELTGTIWNFKGIISEANSSGSFTSNQAGETAITITISGTITVTPPVSS